MSLLFVCFNITNSIPASALRYSSSWTIMNNGTPWHYHHDMKMKRNYMFKWSGGGEGLNKKWSFARIHDTPKHKRDMYFALDAEMVGIGPEGRDSALARVSIVNWENGIVFHSYVKVEAPVTDYRSFVSGIQPEQIEADSAMSLLEVRRIISSILHGKILIGHGLEHDLKIIGIQHPWCDIRDTATYEPFMRVELKRFDNQQTTRVLLPRKLKCLTWEKLGREIQIYGKPHSPIEDAIASMDLYKSVRYDWEEAITKKLNANSMKDDTIVKRSVPGTTMPVIAGDQEPLPVPLSPYILQPVQVMQSCKQYIQHHNHYNPSTHSHENHHRHPDNGKRTMKSSFPLYHSSNSFWSNENNCFHNNKNNHPYVHNAMNHIDSLSSYMSPPEDYEYQTRSAY